jgi:AsmA protein
VDDLLRGEGSAPRFEIVSVKVERSRIDYRDVASGARYELTDLGLESGRIANATDGPLAVAFKIRDGADTLRLACSIQGRLAFDLDRRTYALDKAKLKIEGRAFGVSELSATFAGSAAADVRSKELRQKDVSVAGRGTHSARTFDIGVDTPQALAQAGRVRSDAAKVSFAMSHARETARANAVLEGVEYSAETVGVRSAAAEAHVEHAGRTIEASIVTAAAFDRAAGRLAFADARSRVSARGAGLPREGIRADLSGDAELDVEKEAVHAVLAGTVNQSAVKARVGVTGFAAPAYTFAIDVDRFDADRYVAPSRGSGRSQAFDLSRTLSGWPATGTLRIGVLRTSGVTARNVRLVVKP